MKFTQYFMAMRQRADRSGIALDWIVRTISQPEHEVVQKDGRIRRWRRIDVAEGRWLRVVLLEDGVTVHNAFFDRGGPK